MLEQLMGSQMFGPFCEPLVGLFCCQQNLSIRLQQGLIHEFFSKEGKWDAQTMYLLWSHISVIHIILVAHMAIIIKSYIDFNPSSTS